MAVTVKDILSHELFKDAEIVAGKKGLDNRVGRINFTDCPFPEDIKTSGLIKKGDLFINSFYIVKEDEEKLLDFIKAYIECGSSGSLIITEYFDKLPQSVLDLSDSNDFPVIFIDHDVPYAEIIKTTMETILADQSETILEMKIDKILEPNPDKKLVSLTAYEINRNFKTYYVSFYIKDNNISVLKKQMFISNLKTLTNVECVKYKNGFLVFYNFEKLNSLELFIMQISSLIKKYMSSYHMGISNIFNETEEFNSCIKQSLTAFEISDVLDSKIVQYKDIDLYKILFPLRNNPVLKDFYTDIINPLTKAETSNDKNELLNTIEAFLTCDGDFKKTAALLNQHENTVRYRISKAKRLLNLENENVKFIESVSIALKIRNILKL